MPELGTWVLLPENQAAHAAVRAVADCLCTRARRRTHNPLFLHGPPGCGKSRLAEELVAEVTRRAPDSVVTLLPAGSLWQVDAEVDTPAAQGPAARARQSDLVILEDLQHLPAAAAEGVTALLDHCLAWGRQMVITANVGPARLRHLPVRLTSRLAAGLVVGVLPLTFAGRSAFLKERLARRGLTVDLAILKWLAQSCDGSARQLEGAAARIEALAKLVGHAPSLAEIVALFHHEAASRRLTVERITRSVGIYFQVAPRALKSRRRSRDALLPRQVSMYLARHLTELSLEQIGAYFGGRDHSTVLHACRKVEDALGHDTVLCSAVRQLAAEVA